MCAIILFIFRHRIFDEKNAASLTVSIRFAPTNKLMEFAAIGAES